MKSRKSLLICFIVFTERGEVRTGHTLSLLSMGIPTFNMQTFYMWFCWILWDWGTSFEQESWWESFVELVFIDIIWGIHESVWNGCVLCLLILLSSVICHFFLNESLCLLNVGKLRLLKELTLPTYNGYSVAEKEYNWDIVYNCW